MATDVSEKLWGGETDKAVDNFPVSGHPIPGPVVHWLGRLKAAAARVNAELGRLDTDVGSQSPVTPSPPASTTTSSRSTSSRPAPGPRRT